jgi:hypothetical protein
MLSEDFGMEFSGFEANEAFFQFCTRSDNKMDRAAAWFYMKKQHIMGCYL